MGDIELPAYDSAITGIENGKEGCINSAFEPDSVTLKHSQVPLLYSQNHPHTSCNDDNFEPEGSPTQPLMPNDRPNIFLPNVAALTEGMIRNICCDYVQNAWCYDNRIIKNMTITSITNSYAFKYKLESLKEKRKATCRFTPYFGQVIDGPENGPEPDPWRIVVPEPAQFENENIEIEVPHTADVKQCGTCLGSRKITCHLCYGKGTHTCVQCGEECNNQKPSCDETSKKMCSLCFGTGLVECQICDGYGRLKHYKSLIIDRKIQSDEIISNVMNMPRERLSDLSGRVVFSEQCAKVLPLMNAPNTQVLDASSRLISKHQITFSNELILTQRHTLRVIPLTKVTYTWNNMEDEFYIYGFKNKVYFNKFPHRCHCYCVCM